MKRYRSASHVRTAAVTLSVLGLTAACSQPSPPPPPPATVPPPVVQSAEARAKFYQDCWALFNNKAWEQFGKCYAADATSETIGAATPVVKGREAIVASGRQQAAAFSDQRGDVRLVLVNGPHLASVALWTATNDGPLPGPDGKTTPATKKKIGLLMAHTAELDANGTVVVRDAAYLDEGVIAAQLGLSPAPARAAMAPTGAAAEVVIAKNDDVEAKNIAAARAAFDASNKHDVKGMEAVMADDYTLMEMGRPTDLKKKEALDGLKEMIGAFPDVKFTVNQAWASREYAVVEGTLEGTNTGNLPSMGLKKTGKKINMKFLEIFKLENGKIKNDWIFYNGAQFAAQLGLQ